jgi:hypothetical protein
MRLGISILLGPVTLFLGIPRCRFSLGRGRESRRKPPSKCVGASRELLTSITPATAAARDAVSTTGGLDPQLRQDAINALQTLGYPKRQAQARVAAVTAGSSAEELIKAALQGGR